MTIQPGVGVGIVLVTLGATLACLHRASHRRDPEAIRKALHVIMGALTLSFPWLFLDLWPVLLLAACALAILSALRCNRRLRASLGRVLFGVSRTSCGEIYFVLGTAAVFVLAAGNALLFCIPMLLLTFADAAAALVGTCYGRHRYADGGAQKSLEGSGAFFTVGLLCAWFPLMLFTTLSGPQVVMVALCVALAATILEAVSSRGLDNLLVPLGAFVVLEASWETGAPPPALGLIALAGAAVIATWSQAGRTLTAANGSCRTSGDRNQS